MAGIDKKANMLWGGRFTGSSVHLILTVTTI